MREAAARLLDLGFSDKEAGVYLAMLEIGPATAQQIAKKAGVKRTTAYLLIQSLKKRGLASDLVQDRKSMFVAESPARLQELLNRERETIEVKKRRLEDVIPCFMAIYNAVEEKPSVRFFEEEEGMTAVREAVMREGGEVLTFAAVDEHLTRGANLNREQRQRLTRRMRGKYLVAVKPGCRQPAFDARKWEIREIPFDESPFSGEINIVGDCVIAVAYTTKVLMFMVRGRDMARMFRSLFLAAWKNAKPIESQEFLKRYSDKSGI